MTVFDANNPSSEPRRKVYFAHHKKDYGTEKAEKVKQLLLKAFSNCDVLDPEDLNWDEEVKKYGSHAKTYFGLVSQCTFVVIMEYEGHIGRGVYQEATYALLKKKPVWVVRGQDLLSVRYLHQLEDISDWYKFATVELSNNGEGEDENWDPHGDDRLPETPRSSGGSESNLVALLKEFDELIDSKVDSSYSDRPTIENCSVTGLHEFHLEGTYEGHCGMCLKPQPRSED